MTRSLFAGAAILALLMTPACAQAKVDTADKEAIEEIVHDYILENPEIIEEALLELMRREQEAEAAQLASTIEEYSNALYNDPEDFSVGPADAPVTVVEFFDYRCGFCKRSAEWAINLPEQYDGQVRVVFKEYPLLSPESEKAALAAIAAGRQDKYIEMHMALMELDNGSGFDAAAIDAAAESVGLDVAKMRADMTSLDVQRAVSRAKSLGRSVGVSGTPNFYVGNKVVQAANTQAVEALIEEELSKIG